MLLLRTSGTDPWVADNFLNMFPGERSENALNSRMKWD